MMVKDILTIEEAVRLYTLLAPFWPSEPEENIVLFAGTILNNMQGDETAASYVEAVSIMSGYSMQEIVDGNTGDEVLDMFITGLSQFEVPKLKYFIESLNNGS